MKGFVCFSLSFFLWAFHFASTTSVHGYVQSYLYQNRPSSSRRTFNRNIPIGNRSFSRTIRDPSSVSVKLGFHHHLPGSTSSSSGGRNNDKRSSSSSSYFQLYSSTYNSSSGSNIPNQDYGIIVPEDGYGSPCVIKVRTVCDYRIGILFDILHVFKSFSKYISNCVDTKTQCNDLIFFQICFGTMPHPSGHWSWRRRRKCRQSNDPDTD
jgi:hypothetical protein